VVGCNPCQELQLAPCSPLLAVVVRSHVVVAAASVREVEESGCDFAAEGGGHHHVVALLDSLGEAHCLDAARAAPLAADDDHAREGAHDAGAAAAALPASVEAL